MPRKQYHVIYKTTCKVNDKYYVGMHSTDDLDDGYLGSGKYLWNSIRKHGKDNHGLEVLEFFDNRKELREREEELINEDMLQDPMCMNLRTGGEGGFISVENQFKRSQAGGFAREKNISKEKKFEICSGGGKKSVELKVGIHDKKNRCDWTDRKHMEESKKKISVAMKERGIGCANSQFGSCWIMNLKLKQNKKIPLIELASWIDLGWIRGRKIKFHSFLLAPVHLSSSSFDR